MSGRPGPATKRTDLLGPAQQEQLLAGPRLATRKLSAGYTGFPILDQCQLGDGWIVGWVELIL